MAMYAVFFFSTLAVSAAVIPVIIRISGRHKLYDSVGGRKIHTGNISRLGGAAVFAAFIPFFAYFVFSRSSVPYNRYLFLAALLIAFFTGFADDLRRIPARYKLLLQIVSAVLVVASGLTINTLKLFPYIDIQFGFFPSAVITVIWIVAFMNAVNLIDGMDGLSAGLVLISNIFIFIISLQTGNILVASISAMLAGSVLGFFLFNFPPAKIFLGDGGAYFIGFIYAAMPLMGIKKAAALTVFLIPMILMLVPISDVVQVMFNRYRSGKNIFYPDRSHLHHRLMNLGFSTKGILFVMYIYTLVLGLSSILMVNVPPEHSLILFSIILLLLVVSFFILNTAENVIEQNLASAKKAARAQMRIQKKKRV
ncbi:MAG: MraY family glycosyltransferase [Spirochaetota bacterium]